MADQLRARKERAQELLTQGRFDAALGEYRALLDAEPQAHAHAHKIADLLVRLNRIPEAITAYEETAARYASAGDLLKAIAVCKVILQHDPSHTRTQKALADLYARRKGGAAPSTAGPALVTRRNTLKATRPVATESGVTILPPLPEPQAPAPKMPALNVSYEEDVPNIDLPSLPGEHESVPASEGLPAIPLFSQLSRDAFVEFTRQVHVRAYDAGAVIVHEGEEGSSMFAVVQGSASVIRKGPDGVREVLAQLPEGSFFGEMALMADVPRVATVIAAEESLIMEFTRHKLKDIEKQYPSVTRVLERFYRERMLANTLRVSPILRLLTPEQKQSIAEMFKTRSFKPGTVLLHQGQKSDALFLLLRGRCTVLHHAPDGKATTVGELREGDLFGEISLMLNIPVTATVRAITACTVLRLTRANVESVIHHNPAVRQALIKLGSERRQDIALKTGQRVQSV